MERRRRGRVREKKGRAPEVMVRAWARWRSERVAKGELRRGRRDGIGFEASGTKRVVIRRGMGMCGGDRCRRRRRRWWVHWRDDNGELRIVGENGGMASLSQRQCFRATFVIYI